MDWRLPGAVLALAGGAVAQAGFDLERRVAAALSAARPVLIEQLKTAQGGYLALGCLAAIHDGVPRDDRVLSLAIKRLLATRLARTYDVALRLMVLEELPDAPKRRERARRDLKTLLGNQQRNGGGFHYGGSSRGGSWDLSNTQYAALGMRSAEAIGCDVPSRAWSRLARRILSAQNDDGGFCYSRDQGSYPSMTVAGIAVLELTRQYVTSGSPPTGRISKALERAWDWMAEHRNKIGDPVARWTFYFHYGLERAAVLSGKTRVGDVPWYAAGARMLIDLQLEAGGWTQGMIRVRDRAGALSMPAEPASTAFAILFLRRKFKRVSGPVTPGHATTLERLSEQATERQEAEAVEAAVARGRAAVPDALKAMRSTVGARRRAAAIALLRITGRDFGYDPALAPTSEAAKAAIKRAERWWLVEGRRK